MAQLPPIDDSGDSDNSVKEQLRTERMRLRCIVEGTRMGTWEWNVQSGETTFNQRWAEIIGYTLEELSPVSIDTWMKYAHPDDLAQSDALLQAHFRGETSYYEFESRMKHKDGHWVWVLDKGKVFSWTADGQPLMMYGSHQDITERKRTEALLVQSQARFEALSKLDQLTQLLNRRGWEEKLAEQQHLMARFGTNCAVYIIDLDGLKTINDAKGHQAGDQILIRTALCLKQTVREVDVVARLGGDEFAILVVQCDQAQSQQLLSRLRSDLQQQEIRASVGQAYCHATQQLTDAVSKADRRMYTIKHQHRQSREPQAPAGSE